MYTAETRARLLPLTVHLKRGSSFAVEYSSRRSSQACEELQLREPSSTAPPLSYLA